MYRIVVVYEQPTDRARFLEHYQQVHVPLVQEVPGLSRFLMTEPRPVTGTAPGFVAEMWFPDLDTLKAAADSDEMAAAAADAAAHLNTKHVIFSGEVLDPSSDHATGAEETQNGP